MNASLYKECDAEALGGHCRAQAERRQSTGEDQ